MFIHRHIWCLQTATGKKVFRSMKTEIQKGNVCTHFTLLLSIRRAKVTESMHGARDREHL